MKFSIKQKMVFQWYLINGAGTTGYPSGRL